MLVMLSEGGETKLGTNVNFLLEEFGIALNNGNGQNFSHHCRWSIFKVLSPDISSLLLLLLAQTQ